MSKNIGKWFEGKTRDALKELQAKHGIFFHKLHDSHSAGQVIGSVPADFLVAYLGAQLWEVKASEVHESLRGCLADMVDDGQVAAHRLWLNNGCKSFFIFYSDLTAMVEVWRADAVIYARLKGRPLNRKSLIRSHPIDTLRTCLWHTLSLENT